MDNEFTSEINSEWTPEKVDRFKREDLPALREIKENPIARGIARQEGVYVGDPRWVMILQALLIIAIIGFIVGFLWMVNQGKFQSNVDYDSVVNVPVNNSVNVNNTISSTTENTYQNNFSVYNTIICPGVT